MDWWLLLFLTQKLVKLIIFFFSFFFFKLFSQRTDYDAKITDIEGKYFTTADCNKFMNDIMDAKIKQKNQSTKLIFLIL